MCLNLLDVLKKIEMVVFKPYVWAKRWFGFLGYQSHRLQRNGCSFYAIHHLVCSIWTATRSLRRIWSLDRRRRLRALNLRRIGYQPDASIYVRWWSCQWLAHVVPCAGKRNREKKTQSVRMIAINALINDFDWNRFSVRYSSWGQQFDSMHRSMNEKKRGLKNRYSNALNQNDLNKQRHTEI